MSKVKRLVAVIVVFTFSFWLAVSSYPVYGQQPTPDQQALKLIEESEGLYQNRLYDQALNKLNQALSLTVSNEIKALACLEVGYVKFLMGKRSVIYRIHIEEALKWNPTIQYETGDYSKEFIANCDSIKSETVKEEIKEIKVKEKAIEKPVIPTAQVKKKHFPWIWMALGLVIAGGLVYYFVLMKNTLEVKTTPAGAKVYLDGTDTGQITPCTLKPSTGSHQVKASLEGYSDVERTVEIKKGKNSLEIALTSATFDVSAPVAGQNVERESETSIEWSTGINSTHSPRVSSPRAAGVTLVNLELYQGESKLNDIGLNIPNTGSYQWNMPGTIQEGLNRRIKVSCTGTPDIYSYSSLFNLLGFREDFSDNVADSWIPDDAADWSTANGIYTVSKGWGDMFGMNVYDYAYENPNFTVETKIRRTKNPYMSEADQFVFLGISKSLTNASGYLFAYFTDGAWIVYAIHNYNFVTTASGSGTSISFAWTNVINKGLNVWNTMKVIKNGTNYTLYINNQLMHSFNNSLYNPKYLALGILSDNKQTMVDFDYVHVNVGSATGSVPGQTIDLSEQDLKKWDFNNPLNHKK